MNDIDLAADETAVLVKAEPIESYEEYPYDQDYAPDLKIENGRICYRIFPFFANKKKEIPSYSVMTILTFKLLENGRLWGGHCVPLTFCSLKNAVNLKF